MLNGLFKTFENWKSSCPVADREVIFREVPVYYASFDLVEWGFSLVARTDYRSIGTTFDLEYVDPRDPTKFITKKSPTDNVHNFSDFLVS